MYTKDDWKYIARRMRDMGYSTYSISLTLSNCGHSIPLRTLYNNLPALPCSWVLRADDRPLTPNEVVFDVLGYAENDPSDLPIAILPYESVIYTEDVLPATDSIDMYVWFPTRKTKSGIKTYLDYERRQNHKESRTNETF